MNRKLYNNFIDFKQAFDSVAEWVLRDYGIPERMVALLEDLNSKSIGAVRMDTELTDWFKITVGVQQRCNLLPYLFSLILEVMMHEAPKSIDFGVQVCGKPVNNLRFADNIDLIAESQKQHQELTDKVRESSKRFGMRINAEKTKVIVVCQRSRHLQVELENEQLAQVEEVTYL